MRPGRLLSSTLAVESCVTTRVGPGVCVTKRADFPLQVAFTR